MTGGHADRCEKLAAEVADRAGPWVEAIAAVPRHEFVPNRIWLHDPTLAGNDLVPLDRNVDEGRWLDAIYRADAVNTQVDDGRPDGDSGWEVTSSTSSPLVMADMLAALPVDEQCRVLEIGTGTGWNAALLAYRFGAHRVTSIEIDAEVAAAARAALQGAGYGEVHLVVGDGTRGVPDRAPYDAVLATVEAWTVPYSWVAQTRPGGRVVVPLAGTLHPPGVLALEVHHDGTATGRIVSLALFMPLRGQRAARPRTGPTHRDGSLSSSELHPWWVGGGCPGSAVAIEMRMPGLHGHWSSDDDALGEQWLWHVPSGSWAVCELDESGGPWPVRQGGPRRLWDEGEVAASWWRENGEPSVGDWQWTGATDGQRVQLRPAVIRRHA